MVRGRSLSGGEADMAYPLAVWLAVQEELLEDGDTPAGLEDIDDDAFFQLFHLSRPCFAFVADAVRQHLEAAAPRSPYSVDSMIMVALNYFARGGSSAEVLRRARLASSDFLAVVRIVSAVIADMEEQFISFPSTPEAKARLAARMETVGGIPDAVGILGPAHFNVRVLSPMDSTKVFVNELGFKSVVNQMVCDLDGNVLSVGECCVGSSYEQDMWEASSRRKEMEEELQPPYRLIGANGYHLSKHILSPVSEPSSHNEMCFNKAIGKIQDSMRATLVTMKKRFWCLTQLGHVQVHTLRKKSNVVKSCCVLHNIALKFSVPVPDTISKVERPHPGKMRSKVVDADPEVLKARQELIDSKFCVYVS